MSYPPGVAGVSDRIAGAATLLLAVACSDRRLRPGAEPSAGPPLNGIAGRAYIAGVLTNSPANMTRWIQHPQKVDPHTAMAEMGLTAADARDIASYLYTLE